MIPKISLDIGQFLIKIWDAAAGELTHHQRPKPHIEELKKASKRLETKADDIKNIISLAQLVEEIPTSQVQLWLTEMEELIAKAAKTELECSCLGGWSWNCFSLNRRVAKRMDEIDKLMKRVDATLVTSKSTPPAVVQIPILNSTIAMESYMSEILGYIASTNVGAIGVYGMGGVGKTTLLKSINNHKDVAKFDLVIWAVASKGCRMEKLQMDIAKRLKLPLEKDDSEEERANKLFRFLKNKDCLLLLDNVWEMLNLEMLGMVHAPSEQGEQKRKVVVFTTRDEQVCGRMMAKRNMRIKCLNPDQAWELFKRNAGEDAIGSDVGINDIARQIVKKCAGLPLALATVGRTMSTKKSYEAWNDALTLMKQSHMPILIGENEENLIFSAFKLSYDNLEDDDMRNRLLSCALWPENHLIEKNKLIEYWMGLSLIDDVSAVHKTYNRGYSYIDTLIAACLLEVGQDDDELSSVKMHDVFRDMALWMTSDCGINKFKWIAKSTDADRLAFEIDGLAFEAPKCHVERVSLMYNDNANLTNVLLSTCSKLSVLMLQHNIRLEEIHGSHIQAMHDLTYLDLEASAIREIPKEISILSQLQYLNLSWTPIKKLPSEMGFLVKLKYLFLRGTFELKEVEEEAISKLLMLKLLDLRDSGYNNWWSVLQSLKGCQKSIGIDIRRITKLQSFCLPEPKLKCVSIWRLNVMFVSDSTILNHLLRSHKTRQTMEELRIEESSMHELLIYGNEACRLGGFKCLNYLELSHLSLLKEIKWVEVETPNNLFQPSEA